MIEKLNKDFVSKLNITDDCWLYSGYICPTGYGQYGEKGKRYYAHRYSWMRHYGKIPKGLCVLHKRDVRNCVNPSHLFLGTHQDNMDDMINKGRSAYGERSGRAKLSQEEVNEIRKLYKPRTKGMFSAKTLSEKFNISRKHISQLARNERWNAIQLSAVSPRG